MAGYQNLIERRVGFIGDDSAAPKAGVIVAIWNATSPSPEAVIRWDCSDDQGYVEASSLKEMPAAKNCDLYRLIPEIRRYKRGDRVWANGYQGVVQDEYIAPSKDECGMYDVRLSSGDVCMSASELCLDTSSSA